MPIYVKQNGDWKQVERPYVKRDGQWILPEEAYIKENGEWRLIFDKFRFEVQTLRREENKQEQIFTGKLTEYEDFSSVTTSSFIEYGEEGESFSAKISTGELTQEEEEFSAEVAGLKAGQNYQFRALVEDSEGRDARGRTLSFSAPNIVVETNPAPASDVFATSAQIRGDITTFDRVNRLANVSFEFGEVGQSGFPQEFDAGTGRGSFDKIFKDLEGGTDYKFRAKAKFGGVTVLGQERQFQTDDISVGVSALSPATIGTQSAELRASVTDVTGRSFVGIAFKFRKVGDTGFAKFPPEGQGYIQASEGDVVTREITDHPDVSELDSDTQYEYKIETYDLEARIEAPLPFESALEQFTTDKFNITLPSVTWNLEGGTFNSGDELTIGGDVAVNASVMDTAGEPYDYEIVEIINGTPQGTVAQGTASSSPLKESWQVGDAFTKADISKGDTVTYELTVSTTINGLSSSATAERSGVAEGQLIKLEDPEPFEVVAGESSTFGVTVTETSGTFGLEITGAQEATNADFTVASSFPITVPPGSQEDILVEYAPDVGDSATEFGTLEVFHDGFLQDSPVSTRLSGVPLSPPKLDTVEEFTITAPAGGTSTEETEVFEIQGDSDANLTEAVFTSNGSTSSGPFSIDSFPQTILASSSGDVNVTLDPSDTDPLSDDGVRREIEVKYNGQGIVSGNETTRFDVVSEITGEAILEASPDPVAFGQVQRPNNDTIDLILSNIGEIDAQATTTITDDGGETFSIISGNLNNTTVPFGNSKTVTVQFNTNMGLFNLSKASYTGTSFFVGNEVSDSSEVTFNNDGTKVFVVDSFGGQIYEYSLGTAFDISTASYSGTRFFVGTENDIPEGLEFSGDGTKMFVVGYQNEAVYEYSLGTAFDISTASYSGTSFDVSSEEGVPTAVRFKTDGTKMFVLGLENNSVHEYSLSTEFDISTTSFNQSFGVDSETIQPGGMEFNEDGTTMFISDSGSIFEYDLSVGFDLSTASYTGSSFNVGSEISGGASGITFGIREGVNSFFFLTDDDYQNGEIYEYSVGSLLGPKSGELEVTYTDGNGNNKTLTVPLTGEVEGV